MSKSVATISWLEWLKRRSCQLRRWKASEGPFRNLGKTECSLSTEMLIERCQLQQDAPHVNQKEIYRAGVLNLPQIMKNTELVHWCMHDYIHNYVTALNRLYQKRKIKRNQLQNMNKIKNKDNLDKRTKPWPTATGGEKEHKWKCLTLSPIRKLWIQMIDWVRPITVKNGKPQKFHSLHTWAENVEKPVWNTIRWSLTKQSQLSARSGGIPLSVLKTRVHTQSSTRIFIAVNKCQSSSVIKVSFSRWADSLWYAYSEKAIFKTNEPASHECAHSKF